MNISIRSKFQINECGHTILINLSVPLTISFHNFIIFIDMKFKIILTCLVIVLLVNLKLDVGVGGMGVGGFSAMSPVSVDLTEMTSAFLCRDSVILVCFLMVKLVIVPLCLI